MGGRLMVKIGLLQPRVDRAESQREARKVSFSIFGEGFEASDHLTAEPEHANQPILTKQYPTMP